LNVLGGHLTGFELIQEDDVMSICLRCTDKRLDGEEVIVYNGGHKLSAKNPEACYTDRKSEIRIL